MLAAMACELGLHLQLLCSPVCPRVLDSFAAASYCNAGAVRLASGPAEHSSESFVPQFR